MSRKPQATEVSAHAGPKPPVVVCLIRDCPQHPPTHPAPARTYPAATRPRSHR